MLILRNFNFTKKFNINVKSPARSLAERQKEKMNVNRLKVSAVQHSGAKPASYYKKGSDNAEAFKNAILTVICGNR